MSVTPVLWGQREKEDQWDLLATSKSEGSVRDPASREHSGECYNRICNVTLEILCVCVCVCVLMHSDSHIC